MAIKRRKRKNTPLGGPGELVTTRLVTVNTFVRNKRVLTRPYLPYSERSLLRLVERDGLRSRRRPIRGRRQICRRHDPMASCLVWTHFCYFIQRPGVYSQWKAKKTQPQLFANLAVATNHTENVPHDRKQQKIERVNPYSAPSVAH